MKKLSLAILTILFFLIVFSNQLGATLINRQVVELQQTKQELLLYNEELTQKNNKLRDKIDEAHSYDYSNLTLEQKFRIAANEYGIDFKMLYAIAYHETGNFKSTLWIKHNNPGGLKGGDGWMHFNTEFEGIMAMARILYRGYISKGLDTLAEIQPIYCPDSDSWTPKVQAIMDTLYE